MRILMIVAPKNFHDEEYLQPKQAFEAQGFEVKTASLTSSASGMLGLEIKTDLLLDEVNVDSYDAIVFVGGSGASVYFTNIKALEIARKAAAKEKTIGAICIAPAILANAGVLARRKATVFPDKRLIENLKDKGAFYVNSNVIGDDNIITADGPNSARLFAKKIIETLL